MGKMILNSLMKLFDIFLFQNLFDDKNEKLKESYPKNCP